LDKVDTVAVEKKRLRDKSEGCETKLMLRDKVKVGNKSWIGLNSVERMDKNGMTHVG